MRPITRHTTINHNRKRYEAMNATTPSASATTTRRSRSTRGAAPTESAAGAPAMEVTVQQERLKRGLTLVGHAVASKSAIPVLQNVLLETDGASSLRISATNLEIGIVATVAARVSIAGAITLPARLLTDVVSHMPNDSITLTLNASDQSVQLVCGRYTATIKGVAADEFPTIPTGAGRRPDAVFAPEAFCSAIAQVAFAAASDDTRPILTGVRVRLRGARAAFAATDTFRIAFRDITLDAPVACDREVVVPARALTTFGKVLADAEGALALLLDEQRVIVRTDEVEMVARCLEGAFPPAEKYLGSTFATVVEIDARTLTRAVKLAALFAAGSANAVRLTFTPAADGQGALTISANASEIGDNTSEHAVRLSGPGGRVALNVAFLAQGLDAIATATVAIAYNSPQQVVVLRGVGDETYTHVAMPMTLA